MNRYNPNIHHRRSIRLKGYDYAQAGLYFITICVQNRKYLFGQIMNSKMILNDAGQMIQREWIKLPHRFTNIHLHEYVIMPNHFHAIIEILATTDATTVRATDAATDTSTVRATLVVDPNNGKGQPTDEEGKGQPQGIAPTTDSPTDSPTDGKGQPQGIAPTANTPTLGDMMGAFQSITTVEYIRGVKNKGWARFEGKLWQRNYWEHIIRNEKAYHNISNYIMNNPAKWQEDKFYKSGKKK